MTLGVVHVADVVTAAFERQVGDGLYWRLGRQLPFRFERVASYPEEHKQRAPDPQTSPENQFRHGDFFPFE
jgi:hypothetical protein